MSILSNHPYTGVRKVNGKLKVSDKKDWIKPFFNGTPNYEQVTGITIGKTYDVVQTEGFGDVEDVTIIDDNGKEATYGSFFFEEIE